MKAAIYGQAFSDTFTLPVGNLIANLKKEGIDIMVYAPFHQYLSEKIEGYDTFKEVFSTHQEIKGKVDFLLSIGGDGTFLRAAVLVKNSGIPMIGVNTGRLGFLSSISIDYLHEATKELKEESFLIEQRTLLTLTSSENLFGENNFALNELTVHKKDSSSMVKIHAYMNNEFLNSYWADGLIIATPTGSTAYSLSCGGPIILPGSENFEITPIAPHNLNVRPIVIPDCNTIKLIVEGRDEQFLVSLDSRSEAIDSSIELIIKKSDFKINLIRLNSENQLKTIRNKLNWGLDKRN